MSCFKTVASGLRSRINGFPVYAMQSHKHSRFPAHLDSTIPRRGRRVAILLRGSSCGKSTAADSPEEWRRRYAVFWGGMKGIAGALDGSMTRLQNMPRHIPKSTVDSCKHREKSWALSSLFVSLFVIDGEGVFIAGLIAVPGRAADESMLKKLPVYLGVRPDAPDEWRGWCLPQDVKFVGDSGFALRNWLMVPYIDRILKQELPDSAMRFFMCLLNYRLTQLREADGKAGG